MLSAVDRRDLRWLEIGHYAAAAFNFLAVASSWFVFAYRFDELFSQAVRAQNSQQAAALERLIEGAMAIGFLFQGSFVVTLALAGYLLGRQTGYRTGFALSMWNLAFLPFGTIAGAFALIVMRLTCPPKTEPTRMRAELDRAGRQG